MAGETSPLGFLEGDNHGKELVLNRSPLIFDGEKMLFCSQTTRLKGRVPVHFLFQASDQFREGFSVVTLCFKLHHPVFYLLEPHAINRETLCEILL